MTQYVEVLIVDDQPRTRQSLRALGYVLKDTGPDDLVRDIRQVYHGEPTLEPDIARKVLFELAQPPRQPLLSDPLTGRELDVLRLIAQGKSNREISEDLVLAEKSARSRQQHPGQAAPDQSHSRGVEETQEGSLALCSCFDPSSLRPNRNRLTTHWPC